VTIDVVLSDSVVDLVQERADVAIRTGPLQDSRLTARKLGASQMAIVAAPAYLAKHGTPSAPEDLTRHKAIGWTFARALRGWPLRVGDSVETLSAPIAVRASDGEAARLLALGGAGLARLALFHIGPDIEAGRLAPVLEDYNPREREDIHAVYLGRRGQLPARVRAFLDFLGEQAQITDDRLICDPDGTWRLRRGAVGAA